MFLFALEGAPFLCNTNFFPPRTSPPEPPLLGPSLNQIFNLYTLVLSFHDSFTFAIEVKLLFKVIAPLIQFFSLLIKKIMSFFAKDGIFIYLKGKSIRLNTACTQSPSSISPGTPFKLIKISPHKISASLSTVPILR